MPGETLPPSSGGMLRYLPGETLTSQLIDFLKTSTADQSCAFLRSEVLTERKHRTRVYSASTWMLMGTAALTSAVVLTPVVHAQTAKFVGVQTTLGSNFSSPYGLAADGSGNVYVADSGTNSVKEIVAVNGSIPASPTINTVASGFNEPAGVAVDSNGNVYVADAGDGVVYEVMAVNGSIPASPAVVALGASFVQPYGVAVDSIGNVYVADAGASEVDEMLAVNGTIPAAPTVVSLGSGYSSPSGLAVDGSGDVFVADTGNGAVEEIVAVNGSIPPNATVNTLSSAFQLPYGIALDGNGNLYVVDVDTNYLSEIVAVNGSIPANPAVITLVNTFNEPVGTAVDAQGNLYVADTANNAVDEIQTSNFSFGNIAVGSVSGPATLDFAFLSGGSIGAPAVLTGGAAGLDFADALSGSCTAATYNAGDTCAVNVRLSPKFAGTRTGAVVLSGANGTVATAYVSGIGAGPQLAFSPGTQSTVLPSLAVNPAQIAIDGSGSIYIADTANNQVLKETASGGTYTQSTVGSGLSSPAGVAVDAAGNVYIADGGNSRILIETPNGGSYTQGVVASGSQFSGGMQGIAADAAGDVYVATSSVIKETLTNGTYTASPVNVGGLQNPLIAVDGSGNLYATAAGTVIKVTVVNGLSHITTVASGLDDMTGITVDGVGDVYLADSAGKSLLKETPSSGNYTQSVVSMTYLNGPSALAVDSSGDLYVADAGKRLLENNFTATPGLTFATITAAGTTDVTDGSQSVTISNDGTQSLTGALSVPVDFSLVAGSGTPADCTTTLSLQPGASCNASFEFAPASSTASGTVNGAALLNDNNLNLTPTATQTIGLNGTVGNPALATHFVLAAMQTTVTAGSPFSLTITAEDSSNNVETNFTGTVTLSSTDPAFVSPGSVTLSGGSGTFQVTLETAGSQTILATQNASTGSIGLTVQPGAVASVYPLAGTNQSAYEGAPFATQLQLQAVDAYGNPIAGLSVVFNAPSTGASLSFAGSSNGTANQAVVTTWSNGIAIAPIATANTVAGQYSVVASISGLNATTSYSLTNLAIPQYLVSVLTDDIGIAGNCSTSGNNSNCSLRDAIAAVDALPAGTNSTIGFASGLTGTIGLSNGVLNLTNNVTVTGAGASAITIDGGNNAEIFAIPSGVTAALSNLTLSHGNSSQYGGAVGNEGTLTVTDCTLSNNTAEFGGAIYSDGSLVLVNDTLSNNTAQNYGGAIDNAGRLIVSNTTVSGNTATSYGGGIDSVSAPTMTNSIVAGNSAATYADIYSNSNGSIDPSNIASTDPSGTSQLVPMLAPLGNFGGTTQTMIPLPGSPAICNGIVADISAGSTTDQRGFARTTSYTQGVCADAGAVQTNYALSFVQQPTDAAQGAIITPAPTVQLNENGNPFTRGAATITLTLNGAGALAGGSAATLPVTGVATYGSLIVSAAGTGDTLTASLPLNAANNTAIAASSNGFNITAAGSSTVSAVSGSGQSAAIGSAFAQPLTVKVTDGNGNAVAGAVVTFNAPTNGAGATLSHTSATTTAAGTASVTATANGIASSTAYSVTATTATGSTAFVLTNLPSSTALTLVPSATTLVYGQPFTVKASISPALVSGTSPTGLVKFYDGSTALTPAIAVASASATDVLTGAAVGTHSYQAQYAGDTNFAPSVLTKSGSSVVISKATSTIDGPTTPVVLTAGAGGPITVKVAGQYAGTGISQPSGSLSYSIASGANSTAAITNGAATLVVPANLTAGTYTIAVTYSGDADYSAASPVNVQFSVASANGGDTLVPTTTTLKTSAAAANPGSTITLTATVAATIGTAIPTGTVKFLSGTTILATAPLNGEGVATYSTSTLAAGSNSITAVYEGTSTFATSTSTAVVETIAAQSFSLTFNPTAITIKQGMSGTVQFTVKSINGFNQPISLSCSGLPADAVCTFPQSVTPSAAGTNSSFTINTDVTTAAMRGTGRMRQTPKSSGGLTYLAGAGMASLCLLFGIPARRRLKNFSGPYALIAAVLLGGAIAGVTIGCGTVAETPTGPSTVTVTATGNVEGTAVTQTGTVQVTIALQ
jgi:predicted outer membrane repeat protein